jgi:hypothetical protein
MNAGELWEHLYMKDKEDVSPDQIASLKRLNSIVRSSGSFKRNHSTSLVNMTRKTFAAVEDFDRSPLLT